MTRGTSTGRTRPRRRTRWRSGRSRAAVLVEAALIFPVLLLLTFGILEYGLLFQSASTTSAATRSGSRLAATAYALPGNQAAAAEQVNLAVSGDLKSLRFGEPLSLWIYRVPPSGPGSDGSPPATCGTTTCIEFTNWSSADDRFTTQSGSWPNPDACGAVVDSVGVRAQVRHDFVTSFFGANRTVTERSVARLEPLPLNQCL